MAMNPWMLQQLAEAKRSDLERLSRWDDLRGRGRTAKVVAATRPRQAVVARAAGRALALAGRALVGAGDRLAGMPGPLARTSPPTPS